MILKATTMATGKFIVFYGVNNLGKSTQAKRLIGKLEAEGRDAKYIKYPLYDLAPSGPIINNYLRGENPYKFSPREAQIIYALNRFQYEPQLKADLDQGLNIVAEDYWGTGVAWGVGAGADKDFLLRINQHLHREDIAFLFTGQRFTSGIETGHLHENDERLTSRVAKAHEELADEFGWIRINANQDVSAISGEIWEKVKKIL